MLDEATARKHAVAWADKVHANLQDLKQSEGNAFFGLLGSLGFEYLPKEGTLAVRAYIFPRDAKLTGKPDLLPFLNKLAAEDPESVSHGTFETCKAPWEPDKQPSLFLTEASRSQPYFHGCRNFAKTQWYGAATSFPRP
jgi:hypothetical protein